jgi:molybdopterin-guanine dinucleotide biosynthesis protein A
MGRDKALLSSGSEPLVATIARQVRKTAGSVALVGRPERYQNLGFDYLADLRSDLGPLAGLEAALASRRGDLNLVVACDMPDLSSEHLERLLRQAEENGALCTVAMDRAGISHPLCAVYRRGCQPIVERALNERRLRLVDLLEQLSAVHVEIERTLWNVNTPQEWDAWQKQRLLRERAQRDRN